MHRFLKVFVLSLALLAGFGSTAHAAKSASGTVLDMGDLSEEQQLAVRQKMVELKKQAADVPPAPTVKRVSEWASLGQQFGAGLAQTAKELGVAANDFVNSPVGKLVAAIIIWKLMGGALVHILGGVAFFIVGMSMWFYIWRRMCVIKSVKHVEGTRLFGLLQRRECVYYGNGEVDDERVTMGIIAFVIVVMTLFITFTY